METQINPRFIIIDDDPINNMICNMYIENAFPDADIQIFIKPEEALAYILAAYPVPGVHTTVLLLDINMPVLTGWDVLERFAQFPDVVRKQFTIFILSSSISSDDKQKAEHNPLVSGFIEKPLTMDSVEALKIDHG